MGDILIETTFKQKAKIFPSKVAFLSYYEYANL
jgi:hypothetical protein